MKRLNPNRTLTKTSGMAQSAKINHEDIRTANKLVSNLYPIAVCELYEDSFKNHTFIQTYSIMGMTSTWARKKSNATFRARLNARGYDQVEG